MSYEGYEEGLCEVGHYHSWGCWDDPPKVCNTLTREGRCGKPLVWWNAVDQTNGEGEFAKLEMVEDAVHHTCPTCTYSHMVSDARYKIPDDQGHKGKPSSVSDMYALEEEKV